MFDGTRTTQNNKGVIATQSLDDRRLVRWQEPGFSNITADH